MAMITVTRESCRIDSEASATWRPFLLCPCIKITVDAGSLCESLDNFRPKVTRRGKRLVGGNTGSDVLPVI